jgi:hypothetical protein
MSIVSPSPASSSTSSASRCPDSRKIFFPQPLATFIGGKWPSIAHMCPCNQALRVNIDSDIFTAVTGRSNKMASGCSINIEDDTYQLLIGSIDQLLMGFLVSRTCNIVANVVKISWGCQGIIVKEVKIFIFE